MAQKKDFIGKVEVRQYGKTGASDDRLPIDGDVKGHHTAVKSKSDD